MQKYTKYFIYKKILHTLHQKNKPSAPIVRKKTTFGKKMEFHQEGDVYTSGGNLQNICYYYQVFFLQKNIGLSKL
jgi:hypothetical protein